MSCLIQNALNIQTKMMDSRRVYKWFTGFCTAGKLIAHFVLRNNRCAAIVEYCGQFIVICSIVVPSSVDTFPVL